MTTDPTASSDRTTGSLEPPHRSRRLIGHDAAVAAFAQALESGQMAHAWMLSGPAGIGKATLAFRLATYLLAHPDGAPMSATEYGRFHVHPNTRAARQIGARAHPDLLVIERPPIKADEAKSPDENPRKSAEIPVDTARKIAPFLHKTPAEGGWRIVIVDEADRLNRNAANAILKVIEEPPRQALIFLVCARPGLLPPTIRSRCRLLALKPLAVNKVAEILVGAGLLDDREKALVLGHLSGGSPGKAVNLFEADAPTLFARVAELVGQGQRLDVHAATELAESISRPADDLHFQVFRDVVTYLVRHILRIEATGSPAHDANNSNAKSLEAADDLAARAAGSGLEQWMEVWEKMDHLFASADRVHLDRRHVALSIIMTLDDALRRA